MIDNRARLFVPLPMNPLHRHLNTQSLTKEITSSLLHVPCSGRTKNLPQPNSTTDPTIIEIIQPDSDGHSQDFIAFARPPTIQDLSLESATLMNLRPLKAFFLQGKNVSCQSETGMASPSPSPPFQSVPSHQPPPPQSAIFSSSGQQLESNYHQGSTQQQSLALPGNSSFTSETAKPPDSPLLPLPISTVTKLKVVFWVNELRRYLFLWETSRINSAHAAELHQLLCKIEDNMADPFLTPQMLGETSLGKVMKLFTHGTLDARVKKVARHVVGYWRKVCLEA